MSGNSGEFDLGLKDRLVDSFLPQESYYRHSDIDVFINITITQILNYKTLLTDELNIFVQENYSSNFNYYSDIKDEKEKLLKQYFSQNKTIPEHQAKFKDSLLSYDFPEFEIYFIAKLFVDGMERKPECWTKLLYNSKNINQYISMRFKYKDLTFDSYILLELYSMTTPENKNLLGTTKIFLFNNNLNLEQGRHIFKLEKTQFNKNNIENDITREEQLDEIGKELDSLINNFYGKENAKYLDYYGKINEEQNQNEKIDMKLGEKYKNMNEKYYFNRDVQKPILKTDKMLQFDKKLEQLLSKTEDSYVVIKFPSFQKKVIYEEAISKNYIRTFKNIYNFESVTKYNINTIDSEKKKPYKKFTTWVYDPFINLAKKDFTSTENPIQTKFSVLARRNDDDLIARERRLNPYDKSQMDEVLNMPDFIEMESKHTILFWSHRYELLKKNTPYALTKIMNSVKWGDIKNENEFITNILKKWKTVEICDILYMLSRKFSVNKMYPNTNGVTNNFEGMKAVRQYAIEKLNEHNDDELNFILLQLVQAIRYEDISADLLYNDKLKSPLVDFLIERCYKNEILATSFYWFIACESDLNDKEKNSSKSNEDNVTLKITSIYGLIKDKFMGYIKKEKKILDMITNQITFKKELVNISTILSTVKNVENKKAQLRSLIDFGEKDKIQEKEYYLPINPKLKVKGAISSKCTVFKSAKCPVKYSFNVTEDTKEYNPHEDKDHIGVMFKYGDDLRQDQLILQMINYMDSLLKNIHLDYEFTIYKTLATSKSDGFVEFVPDSTTIYEIIKKKTMREYYEELSNHDEKELNKKLESYINSCAGYCVVTYLLGIGDRHLENLMIDKNGRLFHIDFGYILGKDPKPMPPPIKLCKEMVQCMGGKDSKGFADFQQKCVNAYWVLRENARVIVNMFYLMIDSGIPELNNIDNLKKLHEKFVPQKNKQEAAVFMLDNLKESVDALMPVVMETFHAWAQYWKN